MPTASYNKFTPAVENMLEGMNLGSDSWAIKLGTAVNQAAGTFTETTNGGGYTTGGNTVAVTSATQSGGTYTLILADPAVWTGTGGGFTARYAILTNTTAGVNVGYWDYGSAQAVAATETFTVDLDGTNGVLQVT